jgi:hypothetical protein
LEQYFQYEGARFGSMEARLTAATFVSKRPKISRLLFFAYAWAVFCLLRPLRPHMFQLPTMNIYSDDIHSKQTNGPPFFFLTVLGDGEGD